MNAALPLMSYFPRFVVMLFVSGERANHFEEDPRASGARVAVEVQGRVEEARQGERGCEEGG